MILIIKNIYKYNDGVDKYCIYLGDSDNSNQIIVAEVGAIDNTRKYRPISSLTKMVMFIDKILYINPNSIISPLFIKGYIVSISPLEFHDLLKDLCVNILNDYKYDILKLIDSNYDPVNNQILDVSFSEKILRFLIWTDKKEELKFTQRKNLKNVFKNNVYWAYMGCNIGCEIEKLRPVLIWKEHINPRNINENSYFVFPISSKIPKKKYYYNIEINVNGQKNIVKVNDGKRISIKRIAKPLVDNMTKQTYCIDQHKITDIKDAIKKYAKDIKEKYIDTPNTTEFGVMFLPIEGLYIEALEMGLFEEIYRDYKIYLSGPTTLSAILNALQLSFKSLAIQKKSTDVFKLLEAVKHEFGKFAESLKKTQNKISNANKELDELVGTRTRAMQRKLSKIQDIDSTEAASILGFEEDEIEE